MRNGIMRALFVVAILLVGFGVLAIEKPGISKRIIDAYSSKELSDYNHKDLTKSQICKRLGDEIKRNYKRVGVENPNYGSMPLHSSIKNWEYAMAYFKCKKKFRKILLEAEEELNPSS